MQLNYFCIFSQFNNYNFIYNMSNFTEISRKVLLWEHENN